MFILFFGLGFLFSTTLAKATNKWCLSPNHHDCSVAINLAPLNCTLGFIPYDTQDICENNIWKWCLEPGIGNVCEETLSSSGCGNGIVAYQDRTTCENNEQVWCHTATGCEKTTDTSCDSGDPTTHAVCENPPSGASGGSGGSQPTCQDTHPTWSCQSLTTCGISTASACTEAKNCERNLCPGVTYCCQGVNFFENKWCLTPEKNCTSGSGLPCPGSYYDTEQACINAINQQNGGGSTGSTPTGTFKGNTEVRLENPIGTTNITEIFGNLIKVALGILGSSALLVFIYGGFVWLTSAGNPEKVKKGTSAMIWAVIGIIVIFSSYAIISLVLQGLGVS